MLTTADVAKMLGIAPGTFRAYRTRGKPRCHPFPPPDGTIGARIHWWHEETVETWMRERDTMN